jgi:hypothetical protein
MQFVAYKYNCARFFSKQHGFPLASYNSSSAHTFMSWGSGTADCRTEQLTITTKVQLRTKYLVHPTVVTLSTSKLCSNNGEVTYQLYSYMLIRNIRSGAEVTGLLMFVLHLVLSDFCATMYFVSIKGHTCYGYETVNGVLKMKVNTWVSLALSVQGYFEAYHLWMDGAPRRLVVFQMMFQTYLVRKFLHCCIYNVRSGLFVG